MSTDILGISAFFHDSAAALVRDGDILAAAQEERFSRRKADPGFPQEASDYCLREGGIDASSLDYIVFYEKPLTKFERLLATHVANAPRSMSTFLDALPLWAGHRLRIEEEILERIGKGFRGEILFCEHHESHAASAFFPSPFEEAAILTLDAVGEWSSSSMGRGEGSRIHLTHDQRFPHSLGMLYSAFTYYTGFKVNSGEYKLMGLAPYGEPRYADQILDTVVSLGDDGSIHLNMDYFGFARGGTITSDRFHEEFGGPPRQSETRITQRDMDLASSIQRVCEEAVLRAGREAHRRTGSRHLVMAGGVALNCVANGRLLREGPFEEVWVQPAAGDAGGALGAALSTWYQTLGNERKVRRGDAQKGSFLGPSYDEDEIGLFLDSVGALYRRIGDEAELIDLVCSQMAEEKVIGWFYGRLEYGPRALGHRSIIGDARSSKMQQTMNLKIKYRESFRPFAPCVLAEYAHEIFQMEPGQESPYMLFVAPVREQHWAELTAEDRERLANEDLRVRVAVPRSAYPAITHVDYSARVQTVDEERHGRYYRLMRRFHERFGSPVIVNTSFNIRGEPIVCTPEDAFRCFLGTEMDCLVLESYVLLKDDQPAWTRQDSENYQAQFALD